HDTWRGWGLLVPPQEVHVYTDGSFNTYTSTSSWAVAIRDVWLESNFVGFPSDERLVQHMHVRGAALFGASIQCTVGVYPAELQAIARTLAMFPLTTKLH